MPPTNAIATPSDCQVDVERWRLIWKREAQQLHAEPGNRDAQRAAQQGDGKTLGHELPRQSCSRRSQRRAHCKLAFARGASRQHEVRKVRAHHEQHEQHGPTEHAERLAQVTNEIFAKRQDFSAPPVILVGELLLEPCIDGVQVGARRLDRDAVTQSADRA